MVDYLFGDLPIVSKAPLSLLPMASASTASPVLTVTRKLRSTRPRAVRTWCHQWRDDDGRVVIGMATTPTGYLLRFPRQCDFAVSADATRIDVRPHRPMSSQTLDHLLADQVLPRCLAQRGELVVHAAGIALEQGIALIVGESGRGKSTLAGLFLRAGRTILTDDCLMLRPTPDAVRALATYPSLRLKPDSLDVLFPNAAPTESAPSYSDKRRVAVPDATSQAAAGRVAAVYILGVSAPERNGVRIEPLAAATSCIRLMEQSFQLDVLNSAAVGRLLARAGEVVTRVPAFALDFPRDFRHAAELVSRIEQHFAGIAGRSSPP